MKTSRRVRLMIVSHGRADGGAGATGANKGLGSSPFSKGLAESRDMSLDVLRTSGRTIAMGEIPFLRGDWTQSNSVQIMLPSGMGFVFVRKLNRQVTNKRQRCVGLNIAIENGSLAMRPDNGA